jgi:hypothetical protein
VSDEGAELVKTVGGGAGGLFGVIWLVEKIWARMSKRDARDEADAEDAVRALEAQRREDMKELKRLVSEIHDELATLAGLPKQLEHVEERMNAVAADHKSRLVLLEKTSVENARDILNLKEQLNGRKRR